VLEDLAADRRAQATAEDAEAAHSGQRPSLSADTVRSR
jgi:hypothetical protein